MQLSTGDVAVRANEPSDREMMLDPQPGPSGMDVGPLLSTPAVAAASDASSVALTPAADVAATGGSALVSVAKLSRRAAAHLLDAQHWRKTRLAVDAATLCLAAAAALRFAPGSASPADPWLAVAFPAVALGLIFSRRNRDSQLQASALEAVAQALAVTALTATVTIAAGSMLGVAHHVALVVRLWLVASVSVALGRFVLLSCRRYAMAKHALATPTLIVGAGTVGTHLARRLLSDPGYGLRPVGFLDTAPLPSYDGSRNPFVPVLSGPSDLRDAVARLGARHVILAFTFEPDHFLVQNVRECQELGIEVSLVPRLFEAVNTRVVVDHIGGLPLLSLRRTNPRGWQFAVKHAIDRGFALIALIAVAPVMIAIAIAVRLTSPGPVLFRQQRVGRDGRTFELLKFRTMVAPDRARDFTPPVGCAPGGIEGEDRRTRIGPWLRGTSLDELPQLINVLRGEMSIVGPRPERPEFVERFDVEVDNYGDRHRVKSGITGWAQVNGLRGQTSIADRVEWDNYYIENWSLWLDLRILILTVAEVLQFRDSNPEAKREPLQR
jgi:exopolysaccharide biosynthesis polyprenyl glycosylphosphotransferase